MRLYYCQDKIVQATSLARCGLFFCFHFPHNQDQTGPNQSRAEHSTKQKQTQPQTSRPLLISALPAPTLLARRITPAPVANSPSKWRFETVLPPSWAEEPRPAKTLTASPPPPTQPISKDVSSFAPPSPPTRNDHCESSRVFPTKPQSWVSLTAPASCRLPACDKPSSQRRAAMPCPIPIAFVRRLPEPSN